MEPDIKQIIIGEYVYPIHFVTNAEIEEVAGEGHYYGYCSFKDQCILVRRDVAPSRIPTILLHEILHACFEFTGLEHDEKYDEEQFVTALGPTLKMVFRDNPQLKEVLF